MEKSSFLRNTQIIILGICIAFATIASSVIISNMLIKIKKFSSEVISVTGSAEKKILSDYMVWRLSFARRSPQLTDAFVSLKTDLNTVKEYLISKGIKEPDIVVSAVNTEVIYKKNDKGYSTNETEGYTLTQELEVRSYDVQKVTDISRQATELIDKGIALLSKPPDYFYTKLAELKLEMLKGATEDAKRRAEQMAASTGNKIGLMRSAKMGVFQITPVNSYEVSDWGMNDTTSLEKKVNSVVKVDFGIAS